MVATGERDPNVRFCRAGSQGTPSAKCRLRLKINPVVDISPRLIFGATVTLLKLTF
jgi:hypothetical protein